MKKTDAQVGALRVDLPNERVSCGAERLQLTPKAFAVFRYLMERPGRLVLKEELLRQIWPNAVVTEASLTTCIREIRKELKDDSRRGRYIETVHRRGYRFIGKVVWEQSVLDQHLEDSRAFSFLVGREAELGQLGRYLEKAFHGERQVVFVTGEPGIGKTALVETFLNRAAKDGTIRVGRGQCVEHYGAGEAYLPWLEALSQLGQSQGREPLARLLHRYAPTWLAQMPWLISPAERERLQRDVTGTARERMLRELAQALEALAGEIPLVLLLEDLQWSDYSSLDLILYLATRRDPARLLLLGTFRPVEVILSGHPLKAVKQGLQIHRQCEEIQLGFISETVVADYMDARFPGASAELARLVYTRTDGNPLFMVNLADYLVAKEFMVQVNDRWELMGHAGEVGVPESLREMIETQVERLSPQDQRMLEAASVAGTEFPDVVIGEVLEKDCEEIQERCEGLAQREQFLRLKGRAKLPDGTETTRYAFIHALYQDVLYHRLTLGRQVRLHGRTGEILQARYGDQAGEIAAELAVNFERSRDYRRAVQYLAQAGKNALSRSAHVEAINLLTKGLELLKTLPPTTKRTQQELMLQISLGAPLAAAVGYAAPEVEKVYGRARELCRQTGGNPQRFSALYGLWRFYLLRGQLEAARELAQQLLALGQKAKDPALLLTAHLALGAVLFHRGNFAAARTRLSRGIALYNSRQHRSLAFLHGQDPGVAYLAHSAWALWYLGCPDQAAKKMRESFTLAQKVSHSHSLAFALHWASCIHLLRSDEHTAKEQAEKAVLFSSEHGFPYWQAQATILRGWALARQGDTGEGIEQINHGLAAYRRTGAVLWLGYHLALLAEAYYRAGEITKGLTVLAEAHSATNRSGARYYEAELHRLKGELLRKQAKGQKRNVGLEAEACFRKAINVARRQKAKSLELRAVTSLSRLWQTQGKEKEAQKILLRIYDWFTEGFDTPDLKEAKALLVSLNRGSKSRR
jgi:DNA-binding winged helix-turn-helix (wHTH) protein/predicted ATPase